jgi:threonine/homoserine/homoserine lactone efflux protein
MGLIFLSAFVAGLAYCAAPGVINAEALRHALTRGFRAALLFQVGALAGDTLWAAVALSGVVVLRPCAGLHLILGVCGPCSWSLWAGAPCVTLGAGMYRWRAFEVRPGHH